MSGPVPGERLAAVEEVPVWLEVNHKPAVTWMCTPDQLEELCVGWLHGEGYILSRADLIALRPCATDLGFRAEVADEAVARVQALALRVIADRLEHREAPAEFLNVAFQAA